MKVTLNDNQVSNAVFFNDLEPGELFVYAEYYDKGNICVRMKRKEVVGSIVVSNGYAAEGHPLCSTRVYRVEGEFIGKVIK